jgi:hypothetical protein
MTILEFIHIPTMQFNISYNMNTIKIYHNSFVLIKADIIISDDYVQNVARNTTLKQITRLLTYGVLLSAKGRQQILNKFLQLYLIIIVHIVYGVYYDISQTSNKVHIVYTIFIVVHIIE